MVFGNNTRLRSTTVVLFVAAVLTGAGAPAHADDSFRCGTRLVNVGDPSELVEQTCGRPTHVRVVKTKIVGHKGVVMILEEEIWTYDLGRFQFSRRLVFTAGILSAIVVGDYGNKLTNGEESRGRERAINALHRSSPFS